LTRQARQVDKCLVAPESAHDFSTSDDLAWPFEQEREHSKRLRLHPDADTCPALFLVPQVGFKVPEANNLSRAQVRMIRHGRWPILK